MTIRAVHHLNCGTMCPIAKRMMGQGGFLGRGHMIAHCMAIETARDGIILVDTGFSTAEAADHKLLPGLFRFVTGPALTHEETAIAQLLARGLNPQDVRHIVVTHLDLDHAGGLSDFPNAAIHLHQREHDAAMARATSNERRRYVPRQWAHGPKFVTYAEAGDVWRDLPAVRKLKGVDADVALLPMFGHTRGHSAVVVGPVDDHYLVHAGDAFYDSSALTDEGSPMGLRIFERTMQMDGPARLASIAALRELNRADDVTVFCAHDPAQLAEMQART